MTKLVLLDVDGTLVDSARIILDSQAEACAENGVAFPGREIGLSVVGLSLELALAELTGRLDLAPALTESYKRIFHEKRQDPDYTEPLYPGVKETVAALLAREDVLLGIATGKSRRGANYILDREDWTSRMAIIRTADDGPSKPHPAMILGACEELGVSPDHTLMVGDSVFDMQMAKAAGARAIAVSYGFQPVAALKAAGADAVIGRFDELVSCLSI
jgi:phosphoglycolate phosphatase